MFLIIKSKDSFASAVSNSDGAKAGYGDIITKEGPIEFLNGTGVVCQNNNKYDTHFHATMCDQNGTVFGGHIVIKAYSHINYCRFNNYGDQRCRNVTSI